ncbi:MAG: DUF2161 family putative PD-(D/E)XK-type phosphodiesterase [Pseudomonadota bacterium]
MGGKTRAEAELYPAVKALLERQGYTVKGEVGPCDVMGVRAGDDPVIVELKTGFSLALIHQGVTRQAVTDLVYLAIWSGKGRAAFSALKRNTALCRRLGLGLLTVDPITERVEVRADPAPYRPRKAPRRRQALLGEFARRSGDPNTGGIAGRKITTAYRQDAIRCLDHLSRHGPTKAATVAAATAVPRARAILSDNHYGWFYRVSRGIYDLTEVGAAAAKAHAQDRADLTRTQSPATPNP